MLEEFFIGRHPIDSLVGFSSIVEFDEWQQAIEPLAKVVSGNLRPHFDVFPGYIFELWKHHTSQSSLKTHSKWDCILSTQTFASSSVIPAYNLSLPVTQARSMNSPVSVLTLTLVPDSR